MKKIFVTAIGGDIGYGVIKALRESEQKLHIIGCDIEEYNISRDLVDEFLLSPPYTDREGWKSFICKVIEEQKVDYFWPVTEPEIKIVSEDNLFGESSGSDFLGSALKVVRNADNILEVALDKGNTAFYLQDIGVMVPKTVKGNEWSGNFPVIIKEEFSCGSHSIHMAGSQDELKKYCSQMEKPVIQEYIGSDEEEYTMTVFSDGNTVNSIVFKRRLGFGGMSRYVELVRDEKFDDIADKAAKAFDLKGSINIQMRKKDDEYYVFEINPRISSTIGFRMKIGFNDVAWWIDMFEGREVQRFICPEGKVYGVRTVEEKMFME